MLLLVRVFLFFWFVLGKVVPGQIPHVKLCISSVHLLHSKKSFPTFLLQTILMFDGVWRFWGKTDMPDRTGSKCPSLWVY